MEGCVIFKSLNVTISSGLQELLSNREVTMVTSFVEWCPTWLVIKAENINETFSF